MADTQLDIVIRLQEQASAKIDQLEKQLRRLDGTAKSTRGSTLNLQSSLSGLASTTSRLNGYVAIAGAAFTAAGGFALKAASDYEQNGIALEVMLGSAEKAKKLLVDMNNFAAKTPFNLPEVVEQSKKLLAYNIEADKLLPTLNALGNIAAGVGKEKLPFLTLAFGQTRTAMKLTGQNLNQFTEAGVPLLEMLAKQGSKTAGQIKADMERGMAPSFAEVERAIFAASEEGGRFFNLMPRQSQTLGGVVSNIEDNIGRITRGILGLTDEKEIVPGGIFDKVSRAAQSLLAWLDKNKQMIIDIATNALSKIVTALTSLWNTISVVVKWLVQHKDVALAVAAALGTFIIAAEAAALVIAIVSLGIGAAIAAIIAVVVGLAVVVVKNWEYIKESNLKTWESIKNGARDAFDAVINFFKELPQKIMYYVSFALGWAVGQFLLFPQHAIEGFKRFGQLLMDTWNFIKEDSFRRVKDIVNGIAEYWQGLADRIVNSFKAVPGRLKDAMAGVGQGLKNAGSGFVAGFKNALGFAQGGVVYASGGFVSRGTDTVPAMLTPGEMVLNRQQQSNLFQQLNGGRGGVSINIYGNVSTAGGTKDIEDLAQRFGRMLQAASVGA